MIARMLHAADGGPQLFEVDGNQYALRDARWAWKGVSRWRGVRVIRLPSDGVQPAETRYRFASVFVAIGESPDWGVVKAFSESDFLHHEEKPMPDMADPERTWLERMRAVWEGES